MKTTVKLSQLRDIAFSAQGQASLIEQLYTLKPKHGGSKIAYRIAALRGTTIRLMGPESAFDTQRNNLLDEYFEKDEGGNRAPKAGPESIGLFEEAVKPLWGVTEEIDVELFPLDAIDAAGYSLSGAEIDALMGLLVQPEATVEA